MILEVAILDVKPRREEAFKRDFATASAYISSAAGYVSHELQRCVEKENRYILLARWKTLAARGGSSEIASVRGVEAAPASLLRPFPTVEHYALVYEKKG